MGVNQGETQVTVSRGSESRGKPTLMLIAPGLFALAFVLTVFADSGSALESLPRPLVVAAFGAVLIQAILSLAFRSLIHGAVVTMLLLTFVASPLLAITCALVGAVVIAFSRWRRFATHPFVSMAGLVVGLVFVIALVRVVTSPAFSLTDLVRGLPEGSVAAASGAQPDIFLIMLDGYPRSDVLAEWGYDNTWFTAALEARGFDVAARSHTNYTSTDLVLPTTFHMKHIDEIPSLSTMPADRAARQRAVRTALDNSPALDRLSDLGYSTLSAGHPADYITLASTRHLDTGRLTDFEHQILNRTRLADLTLDLVLDARRGRIFDTLGATRMVAADPTPTFMFAHVMSPHTPILFDRHGRLPPEVSFSIYADDSGLSLADFRDAYAQQVHYLNGLVIEAIDGITTNAPGAVVVVFSDHGSRSNRSVDADWHSTFFAARTPGQRATFPDDARPIEIFPRLLGRYFGDAIPIPINRDHGSR
jgi:hypothetical protein